MSVVVIATLDVVAGTENDVVGLIIFAVALLIKKSISVYHSNHFIREFIPEEKDL